MTPITYIVMSILLLRNVLASGAITASKQPLEVNYNLRLEISDPDYLFIHVNIDYMVQSLLAASEAPTASKQPQSSNMASDLKSLTPITYLFLCILLIWYGPLWQPLRPLQPPNSLAGQIRPQI